MKRFLVPFIFVATIVVFNRCSGPKQATTDVPKLTYENDLKTVIAGNCSPCHFPPKGNKKPYDNFTNVKTDIDEMIRRIELNPTDKGFMPFKKQKLSDSVI